MERGIARIYNELILSESADKLTLYTKTVERNLKDLGQLSIDIVGNSTIQTNLKTSKDNPGTYEAYVAMKALNDLFFNVTVNIQHVSATYFIFDSDYRMNILNRSLIQPREEFLEEVRQEAVNKKGRNIWRIDPENPTMIVFAKSIRSIYPIDAFRSYGVLIMYLNPEILVPYGYMTEENHDSRLICYINGMQYDYDNPIYKEPRIASLLAEPPEADIMLDTNAKTVYRRINSKVDGWTFIHIMDMDTAMKKVSLANTWYYVIYFLLGIVIIISINRIIRETCNPLTRMSKLMLNAKDDMLETLPVPKQQIVQEIADFTTSYNIMITRINRLITEVYQKQLTIADIKYKMLQKQINPHFLYNTLETIHWNAVASQDQPTAEMTLALSNLLRSSIKKPDIISLGEELELLHDYIVIEQIRFEDRLEFSIDEGNVDKTQMLPKMTIQPIVENCIRHQLEKHRGVCSIFLSFMIKGKNLLIQITDNGMTTDTDKINRIIEGTEQTESNSFGLQNIQYRLQILFGTQYGIRALPEIDKEGKRTGTSLQVCIPYNSGEQKYEQKE
ncbi:MAG: histidine kinase [Treponemataceae bacterium]|nr:histidine kinase [Treponemataceae bacterium]